MSAAVPEALSSAPGPSPVSSRWAITTIVSGDCPGADDNASGTAALIELARAYAAAPTTVATANPVTAAHRIVFLSSDGGQFGALGAEHFLRHSPYRRDVVAVVNLDSVGGPGAPRLEFAGSYPR